MSFAKLFNHERYGDILVVKVPYKPIVEIQVEISGIRALITIDMTHIHTGKPQRAIDELWSKVSAENLAGIIDEYREFFP